VDIQHHLAVVDHLVEVDTVEAHQEEVEVDTVEEEAEEVVVEVAEAIRHLL